MRRTPRAVDFPSSRRQTTPPTKSCDRHFERGHPFLTWSQMGNRRVPKGFIEYGRELNRMGGEIIYFRNQSRPPSPPEFAEFNFAEIDNSRALMGLGEYESSPIAREALIFHLRPS